MQTEGITVTGQGSVNSRPDTARVTLGVRVREDAVATALATAAAETAAVTRSMRDRAIADDDISTSTFFIQPEYVYPPDGEPTLRGYTVSHTLTVTIRDVDAVGAILDAAVAAAGDHCVVEGVAFVVEDVADQTVAARELAWVNARAKAEQLAGLAGVALGAPVEILEHGAAVGGPQLKLRSAEMAFADSSMTMEPGSAATTVLLTVRFAIG